MKFRFILFVICISYNCFGQISYNYFSKADLEKDLQFIREKLTLTHPVFLDKTFSNKWEKIFELVTISLKDSMTQNQFYLIVSPLMSYLNDSHSNFLCPLEQRKKYMMEGGFSFPFSVIIRNNSIFISEYYGEDSILFRGGEEIIQINSITSSDIIKEMQKLIGGGSVSIQNKTIEMNFRTYLWMIFGFEKDYEIIFRNSSNKSTKIFVKGINNEQFLLNRQRYSPVKQEKFLLKTDEIRKVSILTIRSFADLNEFCAFTDSAFQIIKKNNIEKLIIDIRGNMGGRSIVVDSLMNYLTNKQYNQYQKIETRISNNLKEYYKEKYPEKFEIIKDYSIDELVITKGDTINPHNKKYRYTGKLFLLTDNTTFSAAATFAGLFKELKLGVIVGEETGGTIEYYGDFWYVTLPNSGLQFHVSPKRFVQYGGIDMKRGVIPDYLISNKNDSIMGFINKLICNN